ncbi:MAG: hypothetical protein OCU16_05050 [Candidatus Methanospirare jalkutatii]|nr:hypothetical protein [Candidatus Methanoxibalbensis ujae]MCW7080443.1 hypothetical protein [Candidatus Methanospirare jalkutatii]
MSDEISDDFSATVEMLKRWETRKEKTGEDNKKEQRSEFRSV